jgi:HlyD family secretion protein
MTKPEQLFRPAAMNHVASGNVYNDALKVMRPRMWGAGIFIVALLIGGAVWSAFFTIPVSVSGQGIVLAPGGVVDVVADAGGQIHQLTLIPGQSVTPGMVVAQINQPDVELELEVARGQFDDARAFQAELTAFQQRDVATRDSSRAARTASLDKRITAMSERRETLLVQRDGLEKLVDSGTVARDRVMNVSQDVLIINGQIADAEDERTTLFSNAAIEQTAEERERLEAARRVTEARRKVTTLEQQLERKGAVRSPFAGRVLEAKVNIGQMVQPGTSVLSIERTPGGDVSPTPVVIAYVSAVDGKKIEVGMPVEISPATTRREEHGFMLGRVIHVSEQPASSAGMLRTLQNDRLVQTFLGKLGAPFEVTIGLQTDPANGDAPLWSSRRAAPPKIDSGTLAEVRFTVRSTSLLALAIPALQYSEPEQADANAR